MVRMRSPPPTFKSDIRKIGKYILENYAYITINTYNILTCAYASIYGQWRNDRRMKRPALNLVIDRLQLVHISTAPFKWTHTTQTQFT